VVSEFLRFFDHHGAGKIRISESCSCPSFGLIGSGCVFERELAFGSWVLFKVQRHRRTRRQIRFCVLLKYANVAERVLINRSHLLDDSVTMRLEPNFKVEAG
jgi:hypothetical protein